MRALDSWQQRRDVDPGVAGDALVRLDPAERRLHLPDRSVPLAAREFAVVAALVRRPGVVCCPQLLARETWGHRAADDAARVRKQLARARRKLGAAGHAIVTVRSVGYRFDPSRLAARPETPHD